MARWRRGSSQKEGAGVTRCVDAGKEQCRDLREHLHIRQLLPRLGVLGPKKQVRKAARLWLHRLDVRQQAPHNGLRAQGGHQFSAHSKH